MNKCIRAMVVLPLAAMFSVAAWSQVAIHGADSPDGAPVVTPSGAATVRTPGTPGASDTLGALPSKPPTDAPKASSSPSDTGKPKDKKPAHDSKDSPPK